MAITHKAIVASQVGTWAVFFMRRLREILIFYIKKFYCISVSCKVANHAFVKHLLAIRRNLSCRLIKRQLMLFQPKKNSRCVSTTHEVCFDNT